MRNLKRALSLAMATFMLLGMMVVGAGAVSISDFSDGEKIVNQEAVTVLTTLNVLNGREDGSYDPEGVVTRGEMAKMICVILNGGRDPQLGEAIKNSYTDTVGHWAASYIEYCTTLGIIAGRNDGTFDPNGQVTVAEAGKMLLVALGYNAGVEAYTGINWQINTDVRANDIDLYDGLNTLNTNVALTRDNAAQICYNALDQKMVEYSYIITGTADNSIATKPQLNDKDKGTLLREKFNVVKVEGVAVANEFADLSSGKTDSGKAPGVIGTALDAGKTTLVISNNDDQKDYTGTKTFNVVSGMEVLGRNVSIFVKIENNASKAQVIGSAIVSEDNKVVTDLSGDNLGDIADDNDMSIASDARIAYNYGGMTALTNTIAETANNNGSEKILVDCDDDGKVDYVLMNTPEFGKVTKYSTSDKGSITVTLGVGNFMADKSANVVGFDDVAKDDYVMASYIGGKLHVAKAESVTGKIEAYKNNGDNTLTTKITVDGTEYNVAATGAVTVSADDVAPAKKLFTGADKTALDTEATFYLSSEGYIVARGQVVESAYNYAYVIGKDNTNATVDSRVRVVLPDGKEDVYNLDSKSAVKLDDVKPGQVYAYSLNNSGKNIKLTDPKHTVTGGSATFEKGKSTITIAGASNEFATNSTVFYYVDANKNVTVYTGRNNAPSITKSTNTAVYKNNGGTVVSVVFTGTVSKASVGDHLFVYSVGNVSSDYTMANVILNGKDTTESIKVDAGSTLSADTLYTYSVNSDGYYELTTAAGEGFWDSGIVTHAFGKTIVVGKGEYVVGSNTVVVDNHDDGKTPTAAFNGNINQGDKVEVLVTDTDKAVMVLITAYADTSSGGNEGDDTIVDGSGVVGISMSTNAAYGDVNKNLETDNVIIDGSYDPQSGNIIKVPAGKTLVVKGDLTSNTAIDNAGTIIVVGKYTVPASTTVTGTVQAKSMDTTTAVIIGGTVTIEGNVIANSTTAITINANRSLTVGGDLGASAAKTGAITADGALTVKGNAYTAAINANAAVSVTGNVDAGATAVTVNKGSFSAKSLTTTGNVILTEGNATITENLSAAAVTLTKGDLTAKTATATGAITVSAGCTLTVDGLLTATSAGTQINGTANLGSLNAAGQTVTVGQGNLVGTLTVNTTAAATTITVTNGTVTIDGKTTGAVTLTKGTVEAAEIEGNVTVSNGTLNATAITGTGTLTTDHADAKAVVEGKVNGAVTVTMGTIEIGEAGDAATLTDGTLTVGDVTSALTLTKGTLNLNGVTTTALTKGAGLADAAAANVTINLGAEAELKLATTSGNGIKLGDVKELTGVAGAKVTVDFDTDAVTVPDNKFYSDVNTAIAKATGIGADATYVYGPVTGGMGFLIFTP